MCVSCLWRWDGDGEPTQEAVPGHHHHAVIRRLQPLRSQFLVRISVCCLKLNFTHGNSWSLFWGRIKSDLQLTPDKYSIYTNDYNNFISWLISNVLPRPSVEKNSIKNTWRKLYHPFVTACRFNAISFITVTRQIYWTAAWAASAPPLTPQAKWRECRPPPPATRPTLLSRICLQNEHRHDQDWFPSQTFTTTTTRTRLDFLLASERLSLSLSLIATCWMSQKCFDGGSQRCGRVRCLTMKLEMSEDAEHQLL